MTENTYQGKADGLHLRETSGVFWTSILIGVDLASGPALAVAREIVV